MARTDDIVKSYGAVMVEQSAVAIQQDIRDVIMAKQDIASPDTIGSALKSTEPQEWQRVVELKKKGRQFPDTPRINTGRLFNSIYAVMNGAEGVVGVGLDQIGEQQQKGIGQWKDIFQQWHDVPARPFFGISDRVLKKIQDIVTQQGQSMIGELNGVALDPMTISVAV